MSEGLCEKANRGLWAISGSLKFEEVSSEGHKINSADRVFVTYRTVNGKREMFELHFDAKKQKLLDIFLVS